MLINDFVDGYSLLNLNQGDCQKLLPDKVGPIRKIVSLLERLKHRHNAHQWSQSTPSHSQGSQMIPMSFTALLDSDLPPSTLTPLNPFSTPANTFNSSPTASASSECSFNASIRSVDSMNYKLHFVYSIINTVYCQNLVCIISP